MGDLGWGPALRTQAPASRRGGRSSGGRPGRSRLQRERRYATAPHGPPDGAAGDRTPGGDRAAGEPGVRSAQGRERAWRTARRPEAQAGRGRRRGTRGLSLRTPPPPPPSTTKPPRRRHPLPRTRPVPARWTLRGPRGGSTAGSGGRAGGRSPVPTNFPAAAPHLRERSTPSAASWPAAPGPRAPGDRAPLAAVVADPVGSGESGEAVAALAAAAPSSRGAHAAVPTRRPERDIRYIVGIPRASRDPSSRVTPGRIPARAGRPRPCSPPPAPPRRPLPAPPGPAATCPARGSRRKSAAPERRFSPAPRTSRLKKVSSHRPRCQPRKVVLALETGASNQKKKKKKPGRLTIRA